MARSRPSNMIFKIYILGNFTRRLYVAFPFRIKVRLSKYCLLFHQKPELRSSWPRVDIFATHIYMETTPHTGGKLIARVAALFLRLFLAGFNPGILYTRIPTTPPPLLPFVPPPPPHLHPAVSYFSAMWQQQAR
jgi:hypothetical protein